MKVYSLCQVDNYAEVGCYGVFSSEKEAKKFIIAFAKDNHVAEDECGETPWYDQYKKIFLGPYEFELRIYNIDNEPDP